jgi:hypothetical protein
MKDSETWSERCNVDRWYDCIDDLPSSTPDNPSTPGGVRLLRGELLSALRRSRGVEYVQLQ